MPPRHFLERPAQGIVPLGRPASAPAKRRSFRFLIAARSHQTNHRRPSGSLTPLQRRSEVNDGSSSYSFEETPAAPRYGLAFPARPLELFCPFPIITIEHVDISDNKLLRLAQELGFSGLDNEFREFEVLSTGATVKSPAPAARSTTSGRHSLCVNRPSAADFGDIFESLRAAAAALLTRS